MPPKKTQKKKQVQNKRQRKAPKHNLNASTIQKKNQVPSQLQSQQVNVYTHRPYIRRAHNNTKSASSVIIKDSYQPRLPAYHPFNVNVPVTPPLQNPVNVYVNGQPLTHNTPAQNVLHNTGTAQNTTPQAAPSTPKKSDIPEYILRDMYTHGIVKTPSKYEAVAILNGMNKKRLLKYARDNHFTVDTNDGVAALRNTLRDQTMKR